MMLTPTSLTALLASLLFFTLDEAGTPTNPVKNSSAATAIETESTGEDNVTTPAAVVEDTAKQWLLRYKFQDGQTLRYETRQHMTLEATLGVKHSIDTSDLKQRRLFTILKVEENGSARMAMQFEHVWMKKTVDNQEPVVFDSSMKPAEVPNAFRQVARELKGSAPKYWLSTTGLSMYPFAKPEPIQKAVANAESSKESVINLVEGDSENGKIQLVASAESTTTPQEEKNLTDPGSFLMTLPEKEIKVGDTWKETISVPVRLQNDINIQVPILRTFRLESVNNGIARITFRCSVEAPVRNVTVSSQLIQATPRGTMSFDTTRGLMLRREMQYDESVFGALGAESLLTSVGTNIEELIDADSTSQQAASP